MFSQGLLVSLQAASSIGRVDDLSRTIAQAAPIACGTIAVLVQQRSALPVHSLFTSVLSHEHRVGQLPQAQGQHSCPSPRIKPSDAARDEEGV